MLCIRLVSIQKQLTFKSLIHLIQIAYLRSPFCVNMQIRIRKHRNIKIYTNGTNLGNRFRRH